VSAVAETEDSHSPGAVTLPRKQESVEDEKTKGPALWPSGVHSGTSAHNKPGANRGIELEAASSSARADTVEIICWKRKTALTAIDSDVEEEAGPYEGVCKYCGIVKKRKKSLFIDKKLQLRGALAQLIEA
jgi:hypothetical protein